MWPETEEDKENFQDYKKVLNQNLNIYEKNYDKGLND